MAFLVCGLQLHLAAQGICLALLPYCFGALYLWKRFKDRGPLFYALGILFPAIVEKLVLYFLGAYLCGVSPFRVTAVMEAIGTVEPYAVLFTRMPMRYAVNLLFFNWIYILQGDLISSAMNKGCLEEEQPLLMCHAGCRRQYCRLP